MPVPFGPGGPVLDGTAEELLPRYEPVPLDADGLPLREPPTLDEDGLPVEEPMTTPQAEVAIPLRQALDLHARREALRWRVRVNASVEELDPEGRTVRVFPDLYVLVGDPFPAPSAGDPLRTYVLGRGPTVALELSCAESIARDRGAKRGFYDRTGALEYFVLDLDQRKVPGMLEGYRRDPDGRLAAPIPQLPPLAGGLLRLPSAALGLELEVLPAPELEAGFALRAFLPGRAAPLPTPVEDERDRALEEKADALRALDAALRERDAALRERDALEAELRRREQDR